MVHPHPGFKTEADMENIFLKKFGKPEVIKKRINGMIESKEIPKITFLHWCVERKRLDERYGINDILYSHHEGIKKDRLLSCNLVTDAWYKWFLTTPRSEHPMVNPGNLNTNSGAYGDANAYLFQLGNTSIYFTTAAPFQKPDFKRVVMTQKAALLVPVYNVLTSPQLFPEADDKECKKMVEDDLCRIKEDKISATFDGKSIYGCCVMRTEQSVEIANIPKDNAIGIPEDRLLTNGSKIQAYHGGFWLLFREDKLTRGDHLLSFTVESDNYEIDAKILVTSLVG
jgi:hypothetical protein